MGKVSIYPDLSRALRRALGGITQAGLAAKLLVSRNYISQIEAGLKIPSPRLVAQMERMLTESTTQVSKTAALKSGGRAGAVEEAKVASYGGVASRIPQKRQPSTRQDCEDYFRQLMDRADLSDNPNAFPVIHDRLRKHFPLDEWDSPSESAE